MEKRIYSSWQSGADGKCPSEQDVDFLREWLNNFRHKTYPNAIVIDEFPIWESVSLKDTMRFSIIQVIELETDL